MVFYQKEKTKLILQDDFETAIRNQKILSDGEMFLSMFQILDKSQPKRTDNKQVFIGKNGLELTEQQFNAKLFAARKS
jgi:glutamate synthase (ferredoxin)